MDLNQLKIIDEILKIKNPDAIYLFKLINIVYEHPEINDANIFLKYSEINSTPDCISKFADCLELLPNLSIDIDSFCGKIKELMRIKHRNKLAPVVFQDAVAILQASASEQKEIDEIITICYPKTEGELDLNLLLNHLENIKQKNDIDKKIYVDYLKWKGIVSIQEIEDFLTKIKTKYSSENILEMMRESRVLSKHTANNEDEAYNISQDRFQNKFGLEKELIHANSVVIGDENKNFLCQTLKDLLQSRAVEIAIIQKTASGQGTNLSITHELPSVPRRKFYFIRSNNHEENLTWSKLDIILTIGLCRISITHCKPE